MWWLRDRIRGRRRNQRPEQPTGEQPVPETPAPKPPASNSGHPRLVLLVRDAAGPASYQLHSFEDEPEAAAFVQFWFPGDFDHGVIAFWASHREPEVRDGERPAEVVVLVRDESRSKTVCPFSFAGMDLAQSWVARESDRGLDLHPDHVLIFWAVSARISRDHWGRVHLWPSEPPSLRPNGRRATLTAPALPQRPTPAPPASATPVTLAPSIPAMTDPPAETRAPQHDEAPFEQPLELPAELLIPSAAEAVGQAVDTPTEEPPVAEEEAQELPVAGEADEEAPPVDDAPRVDAKPTASKKIRPRKGNEPFGAGEEIEELLSHSRWEKREGPFRGFGSPPGKF